MRARHGPIYVDPLNCHAFVNDSRMLPVRSARRPFGDFAPDCREGLKRRGATLEIKVKSNYFTGSLRRGVIATATARF